MTPGELVMYSILRGDEPPVEVYLAGLREKDFRRLHRAYIGCKQRLAHLIETRARQRLQEQPKGACKCNHPLLGSVKPPFIVRCQRSPKFLRLLTSNNLHLQPSCPGIRLMA
jgi:hypothetical protein